MAGVPTTEEATSHFMSSYQPIDPSRRKTRLGRLVARLHRQQVARQEAEQSLATILEASGAKPLPPPPSDRLLKAGSAALKEGVARSPQARRLADAARRHVEATDEGPGRVQRALHEPRRVLTMLVEGEAGAQPALPGATAPKALPGETIHAGHAASVVATRYGAHLLVLAVVLLVIFAGGAPALHARVLEEHQATGAHDDLTEPEGALLPATVLLPAESGDFLINPAMPITQLPDRMQTITATAGDTPATVAARFNLDVSTVLAANHLIDPDEPLAAGTPLLILPFDGVTHTVAAGDTLESIAQRYAVEPGMITDFKPNHLDGSGPLPVGQVLVVPGGMPPPREALLTYHTRAGDTLDSIAEKFSLDPPTITAANPDLNPDAPIPTGTALRILPVPGIVVVVQAGDTLDGLADTYGTDPHAITSFAPNQMLNGVLPKPGPTLILPGGQMPEAPAEVEVAEDPAEAPPVAANLAARPAQQPSTRGAQQPPSSAQAAPKPPPKKATPPPVKPKTTTGSGASAKGTGRFLWPVSGTITQYFWRKHNGLDIAIRAGTPIHAADSGRVVQAGWRTDGLGYAVQIDHGNGYVTIYGHMIRQPAVRVGQLVARGQVIGYIGSTGHSTGPHVHFIIRTPGHKYFNPLNFLP
jgi:murein DD-endopeptidase MepM/ murein hydrolase activator NlpD